MKTKTGYDITVERHETYPDWFVASAYNPKLNTSTWGSGETEISAIRDCIFCINNGEIFEGGLDDED